MSNVMSVKTRPGDQVQYSFPNNGDSIDKEKVKKAGLVVDQLYTVSSVQVHGFHTDVLLNGHGSTIFNSVMFSNVEMSHEKDD